MLISEKQVMKLLEIAGHYVNELTLIIDKKPLVNCKTELQMIDAICEIKREILGQQSDNLKEVE